MDIEQLHQNPVSRERWIRDYLLKKVDALSAEAFESHYLSCDECFEELSVTRMLMEALGHGKVELRRVEEVLVLEFAEPAQLTQESFELAELQRAFPQEETKVLIDLSRVTKMDSAGLGQLVACYSHAVKKRGMVKLLKPTAEVLTVLRVTNIDSVLETYHDERQALQSFAHA